MNHTCAWRARAHARPARVHAHTHDCPPLVSLVAVQVKSSMSGQPAWFPLAHTDGTIKEAVKEWCKGGDSMEAVKRRFGLIEEWDVSEVTDMSFTFYYATAFNSDLSGWDVSKVTTMYGMFSRATAFDQKLSGSWSTTTADKTWMFLNCPGSIVGFKNNSAGTPQKI